jgi:hypothetical protein
LNREPKKYFLYRVLDEIEKAALKISDWKESLSEIEPEKMQRIDYEAIIDDQQFRARKLAEVLVDAILFSTTDDQAHYGDYFFLHELNECARSQEDRYEFFGHHNKNSEWNANWLCEEIKHLEKAGLDPKSRWYVKEGCVLNEKWTKKGVPYEHQRFSQVRRAARRGHAAGDGFCGQVHPRRRRQIAAARGSRRHCRQSVGFRGRPVAG